MKLNPEIFREYDIRGIVDKDLSEDFAFLLGRAYATLAKDSGKDNVGIGWDCRLSSEGYAQAVANGIASEGLKVVLTGMGPSPQLYFAIYHKNLGGGIQITGSHNPSNMNGFKICLGTQTLSGEQIQDLKGRMLDLINKEPESVAEGLISELPLRDEYIQYMIDNAKDHMGPRKLKVVVDAGNGVGGLTGPAVLRGLGIEVVELFCEADGTFPNHHPDPTDMKNLKWLKEAVSEHNADLGIGWDGDADRIGVINEKSEVIFGDMLLLIYGREILKEEPGATIIGDVKCSSRLFTALNDAGAKAIMWKTGHSLIKNQLKETGGALGGEMSGHIFFKHRYFGFDDAVYASVRLVEILSKIDGSISTLIDDLKPMIATPEIRNDCPEEIKFKIPAAAKEAFAEFEVETIDGVRITFPHGWGLVRASNTQPVLVMRFEAESEALLNEYQDLVSTRIEKIKQDLLAKA